MQRPVLTSDWTFNFRELRLGFRVALRIKFRFSLVCGSFRVRVRSEVMLNVNEGSHKYRSTNVCLCACVCYLGFHRACSFGCRCRTCRREGKSSRLFKTNT